MRHTSALLETSEWHICIQRVAAVDSHSSGPHFVGSIHGAVYVLGKDGGNQTVRGVVRPADNNFTTTPTGPKISSWTIFISGLVSVKIVG